jgi:hypothetical protein
MYRDIHPRRVRWNLQQQQPPRKHDRDSGRGKE